MFTSLPKITKNWKKEAKKAIKWIEEQTGQKFKSEATRNNLGLPSPEVMEVIEDNIKNGYYTPEKAEKRALSNEEKRRADKISDLKEDLKKEIEGKTINTDIQIQLIEMFGTHNNVIYYSHKHELVFNYSEPQFSTYSKKWTEEEVSKFDSQKTVSVPVSIKYKY